MSIESQKDLQTEPKVKKRKKRVSMTVDKYMDTLFEIEALKIWNSILNNNLWECYKAMEEAQQNFTEGGRQALGDHMQAMFKIKWDKRWAE